ncbi:erythromycin esterase family protein [Streptomyces achromogenes]|uniref:erythromycin esterase family protein n=1 Tax=Streptomyces achromogenes TaxID=67255 RepID=UPI003A807377
MTDELQRWLKESALPLRSLDAGASDNDLEPLRHVLDDVRVLGMGEATHGTAEFFRLKHRLLGFLVRAMGFTTLAMEAGASAARAVDDYVVNGTGNAADVLAGLGFWTWRTHEMLAVVEWMRAHNRTAPPERVVRFVGIDPQRCAHSLAVLRELLPTVAPEQAGILDGPLGALADAGPGAGGADGGRALDEARELLRFLEEHRTEIAGRVGGKTVDRALWHVRAVVAVADVAHRPLRAGTGEAGALATRDRYMAQAVISLEERSAGGVAVWAHNGHVSADHYAADVPAMGQHLRKRYGERYYALGLLFGEGTFRARPGNSATRPPREHRISAAGPRSVEARLAAVTPEDHLVDLRAGRALPAVGQWLDEQQFVRTFGAAVPRVTYRFHMTPTVLGRTFDGLAYVASSTPSEPLP